LPEPDTPSIKTLLGGTSFDFLFGVLILLIMDSLKKGEMLWPLRVALSGQATSPSPYEILEVLGKNESLARIEEALKKINTLV